MNTIVKRVLAKWVHEQQRELPLRVQRLISLAKWDLNYGPGVEGQDDEEDSEDGQQIRYPGWSSALAEIRDATDPLIRDIWIDVQCKEVLDREPEGYWEEEDGEKVWNEPCWDDYALIEAQQVKHALLGDLASYI